MSSVNEKESCTVHKMVNATPPLFFSLGPTLVFTSLGKKSCSKERIHKVKSPPSGTFEKMFYYS
jgi:hypothetical protein